MEVEPDLDGGPELHPHEEGAAGPEKQGDQDQQKGVDDAVFPRGQHGHEQEYVAEQRGNRDGDIIAHGSCSPPCRRAEFIQPGLSDRVPRD